MCLLSAFSHKIPSNMYVLIQNNCTTCLAFTLTTLYTALYTPPPLPLSNGKAEPCTPYEFSNTEFHSLTTYKVFACPRYTPTVMFFIEGEFCICMCSCVYVCVHVSTYNWLVSKVAVRSIVTFKSTNTIMLL